MSTSTSTSSTNKRETTERRGGRGGTVTPNPKDSDGAPGVTAGLACEGTSDGQCIVYVSSPAL
eukprot:4950474-Alexandrium_andersonii.AAC.1